MQLFDMKPEEKVSLKYLDKQLYLKKNGSYFKMNDSGNFEPYQKENNSELIKSLDSNWKTSFVNTMAQEMILF